MPGSARVCSAPRGLCAYARIARDDVRGGLVELRSCAPGQKHDDLRDAPGVSRKSVSLPLAREAE
eukprot:2854212-Alexandrium_andersonii.AAC.1